MIPIDTKKLETLFSLIESDRIERDEEVLLCLRCEEPFISLNKRHYRLCTECRNMAVAALRKESLDEWDALLKDMDMLEELEADEPMLVYVSNWDTMPSTASDPWDRIDSLIDYSRKVR